MSYTALYRQYRPKTFDEIAGQPHIVNILKNSVKAGRVAHAYLFTGTRGTGKTSMAHILSRAINCLSPVGGNPCNSCEICLGILSGGIMDILEIDAASNNSVDNVRDLRDEVLYSPSQTRYKVYIIDEVHMLSTGAFNALLKTLEEPPEHVKFILATTEPHKLPATILSRCQRFDFHRISAADTISRLEQVSGFCGAEAEPKALRLIAAKSDGSLRDAISILDQCLSSGVKTVTYADVLSTIGIVDYIFLGQVAEAVMKRDPSLIFELVEKLVMSGKDIQNFVSDMILYFRNLLLFKISKDPSDMIAATEEALHDIRKISEGFEKDEITAAIRVLSELEPMLRWAVQPRIMLEVSLVRLCEGIAGDASVVLSERISLLERKLSAFSSTSQMPNPEGAHKAKKFETDGRGFPPENNNASSSTVDLQPNALKTAEAKEISAPAKTSGLKESPRSGIAGRSTADLQKAWHEVILTLKERGKRALSSILQTAKVTRLDEKIVCIAFNNETSGKIASDPTNINIIEELISEKSGGQVKIKITLAEMSDADDSCSAAVVDEVLHKVETLSAEHNFPFEVFDE